RSDKSGKICPRPNKQSRRPQLETLEDRLAPANLSVTSVQLVSDGAWPLGQTPVSGSTIPEGTLPTVQVRYQATALAAGATYDIRFTLDNNQVWQTGPMTWSSGIPGSQTLDWSQRLPWAVTAGTHTVTVQLDVNNQLAETSETDNVGTVTFS